MRRCSRTCYLRRCKYFRKMLLIRSQRCKKETGVSWSTLALRFLACVQFRFFRWLLRKPEANSNTREGPADGRHGNLAVGTLHRGALLLHFPLLARFKPRAKSQSAFSRCLTPNTICGFSNMSSVVFSFWRFGEVDASSFALQY